MISYSTLTNHAINLFPVEIDLTSNFSGSISSCLFGSDPPKPCLTCKTINQCQGHWGKIKIPQVLYRPSCIQYIEELLPYLCRVCGLSFELSKEDNEIVMSGNLSKIKLIQKSILSKLTTKCQKCNLSNPHITYSKYQHCFVQGGVVVPTTEVCKLLSLIPKAYYPLLSYIRCDYEDLFWVNYVPVPPLFVRYDLALFNNSITKSPLTLAYTDICSLIRNSQHTLIQKKVDSIEYPIDNEGLSFELSKTVMGKSNTFRQMINAYRGDGSTRSILNCFGSHRLNECLLNNEVYNTIEYRRYVTEFNYELLHDVLGYFHNGKYHKGSVKSRLTYGDWVETLIRPGDYVINMRFPSLHQGSIFAAKLVKQIEERRNSRTTKITTMATTGMNGDQDGDEITTKIMYNPYTQYEIITVFNPHANVLHYANHGPSYSTIQQEVISITKLYNREMIYPSELYHLIDKPMSGRQVLECLLRIKIPTMTAKHILYGSNISYTSNIHDFYGHGACVEATELLVQLAKVFMNTNPDSIGPKDYYLDIDLWEQIKTHVEKFNADLKINIESLTNHGSNRKCVPHIIDLTKDMSNKLNNDMLQLIKTRMQTSKTQLNYPYIAKFKLGDNELIDLFVKLRPTLVMPNESHYFGRLLPIMICGSVDPRTYGLYERGYFYGYSQTDMFHILSKARNQVISTACGTAVSGFRARQLIKCMEDVHINELGFIVSNSFVIHTCVNSYKLLTRHLVALSYDSAKKLKNPRAIELRNRIGKLSSEILSPLDIPSAHLNFNTKIMNHENINIKIINHENINIKIMNHENINIKVFELCQYVLHIHMLMLGCVDMLEYVILYYLDDIDVTSEFLDFVIESIKIKYVKSNLPGVPIGMQIAQSIGENDTQATLASFHSTSKSGKDLHESKNDNYRYFDMKKTIGGSTIIRGNHTKLKDMYRTLKYVCMNDLVDSIEISNSMLKLVISNLVTYNVTFPDIIEMISEYAPSDVISVSIQPLNDHQILIELACDFVNEMEKSIYFQSFQYRMSRGCIINVDYVDDTLYVELDSLKLLSYFDTSDLIIDVPLEIVSYYFGMSSVNQCMISNYKFDGQPHLTSGFSIVSAYQTSGTKPLSINKFKRFESSPLKSTAFGSGRFLTDAAVSMLKQKIDDIPSCIFMSTLIPVGTGYYKTSYDITSLVKAVVKEEILDNKDVIID